MTAGGSIMIDRGIQRIWGGMLCLLVLAPGASGFRTVDEIMAEYDQGSTTGIKLLGIQMELRMLQERFAGDARRADITVAREAVDKIQMMDDDLATKNANALAKVLSAKKAIAETVEEQLKL